MNIKKLSIIIPAFNESDTIHLILDKVRKVKLIDDINKTNPKKNKIKNNKKFFFLLL